MSLTFAQVMFNMAVAGVLVAAELWEQWDD